MGAQPHKPIRPIRFDRTDFVKRLVFIRERLGLTKSAFAESVGITKSNYTQVEAGRRMLTVDQMYALFMVHGVPIEYLMCGQELNLPDKFK